MAELDSLQGGPKRTLHEIIWFDRYHMMLQMETLSDFCQDKPRFKGGGYMCAAGNRTGMGQVPSPLEPRDATHGTTGLDVFSAGY